MIGLSNKRKKDKSTGKINNQKVNKQERTKNLQNKNLSKLPLMLCKNATKE